MTNQRIIDTLEAVDGNMGFYYRNLATGETLQYQADHRYEAASVIKLPLMLAVYRRFAAGELHPGDVVTITEEEKVGGCGGLALIPGEVTVNLQGLCNNMIALSDNTATNKLLSLLTLEAVHQEFAALGLRGTCINRFLFDAKAKAAGTENYIVLSEIMELLEGLYRGEVISPQVSQAALDTLKRQQINHKIPCRIAGEVPIAHKTGEDDGISHDVAVVYAKTPFVLGFASNNVDVYTAEDAMKQIALHLYRRNR